jgi:hypothetical protein
MPAYPHTYVPMYLCTYVPMYLCTYVPMYLLCKYKHLHTYILLYPHTYVPMYLHKYIPTYIPICVPKYLLCVPTAASGLIAWSYMSKQMTDRTTWSSKSYGPPPPIYLLTYLHGNSLCWNLSIDRTKQSAKIMAPLHLSTYLALSRYLVIAYAGTLA